MARVSFRDDDGTLRWFDPAAAKDTITEGSSWDGNNHRGVVSGLQIGRAVLYLTSGGNWIENADSTRDGNNGSDSYRYLTEDEVRDWLIRSADADRDGRHAQDALDRYFGELPEENGPGRPETGGEVKVRLGDLLPRVDEWATTQGVKRAEAVRRLVSAGLDATGSPNP